MALKFKNRIAFFNTLSVAITAALVFTVIYLVVYTTAYRHLDNDILLEKEEVVKNLDWNGDSILLSKMPEWEVTEHEKIEVNPTFLQIVDTKGKVIFHSSNLKKGQFLFDPEIRAEEFYNGIINNQMIRLGQFAIKNNSGDVIGQLTIAISRQESFTVLNNLFLVLLISFPLMLLVQILASRFAAAKAISPVDRLIQTASGINQSNIDTRIALPDHQDEIYQLVETINELLNRIETSIKQQKQFTSDASHEIRTPLAAIKGTLEVLLRKQREPVIYEQKIKEVMHQTDRLEMLLDQLLQLARLESGIASAKKEEIQLLPVATLVIHKYNVMASEKHMTLHLNIPVDAHVATDKFYLETILDNLVSNALKYGKENGNVFLNWDKDSKTLAVADDGIGISPEHLPNIFHPFYRVDESRSSDVKGSGLGLSIVKKLADILNISVIVTSKLNEGTTLSLHFHS
jgi:signal transduction histidine kinase